MNREAIRLFATVAVILALGAGPKAAEEKGPSAEVREAFKRFATAVKDDKYEEVTQWIAPPADKFWANLGTLRAAAAKYDAALEEKFGKDEKLRILPEFEVKGRLAEYFYETRGDIREVKEVGKDRVQVTVWTKGPVFRNSTRDGIYERNFTAIKTNGQWRFQLHVPMGGAWGSPVVKKVKRTAPDGKMIEVYAEHSPHDPQGRFTQEKNWEELKPISYDDRKVADLKEEAAELAKFAEVVRTQTEQVLKGTYKTQKEALEALVKSRPRRFGR